jgi:site-specific DNA recombinase
VLGLFQEFANGRLGLHAAGLWLSDNGVKTRKGLPLPKSQVLRILTNRLYIGMMRWRGNVYEGKFNPIVPLNLFETVQKVLKVKSKPRKTRKGHQFPFCGIFRCSCGAMVSAQWAKGHGGLYRYYRCTRKAHVPCAEPYVQEASVASQCLEILRPYGISPEEAAEILAVIDAEAEKELGTVVDGLDQADTRLLEIGEKLRKLTHCLLSGLVDEDSYRLSKEDLIVEKTRLKQERQRLHKSRENSWIEPSRRLIATLETLGKNAETPNLPEISRLVQKLGTNHRISRKTVSFNVALNYQFLLEDFASARVSASASPASPNDKNWWSTKWCA